MSTHFVKPYASQGWGPLPKKLPQAPPGRSQRAEAPARQGNFMCQSRACSGSHGSPSHLPWGHKPWSPCHLRCCKQALRGKKIPNPPQQSGMSDEGHRALDMGHPNGASPGRVGLDSLPRQKSIPWDGNQSILNTKPAACSGISRCPRAQERGEGLLPANLALPGAVSNRDKRGLQENRDTPLFAKLAACLDGLSQEKLSQERQPLQAG